MFDKQLDYLRNNHLAMMALCCLLPVILIFGLQYAGITGLWIYPLAIAICIGSHMLMMALPSKDGVKKSCH
ncbi:hypothetical protein HY989_05435 [Candidatus Micrarchaeota archaeon]|nr:hypothetical protein [Candidatus Micrarchaeota archaeon]